MMEPTIRQRRRNVKKRWFLSSAFFDAFMSALSITPDALDALPAPARSKLPPPVFAFELKIGRPRHSSASAFRFQSKKRSFCLRHPSQSPVSHEGEIKK
jgi:hypothetical protein